MKLISVGVPYVLMGLQKLTLKELPHEPDVRYMTPAATPLIHDQSRYLRRFKGLCREERAVLVVTSKPDNNFGHTEQEGLSPPLLKAALKFHRLTWKIEDSHRLKFDPIDGRG